MHITAANLVWTQEGRRFESCQINEHRELPQLTKVVHKITEEATNCGLTCISCCLWMSSERESVSCSCRVVMRCCSSSCWPRAQASMRPSFSSASAALASAAACSKSARPRASAVLDSSSWSLASALATCGWNVNVIAGAWMIADCLLRSL